MRELRRTFLEQVTHWDAATRTALTVAGALMIVMIGLYAFGGEALRVPTVVGIATLLIVAQGIVLWGNRHMVTPFTQAQRLYLSGQIDKATHLLQQQREHGTADVRELTLLGNIYRQHGDLTDSETVLYEALDISPQHHFPLYGLGRTKLVSGAYHDAAQLIQQALDSGASTHVQADLGEALYLDGQHDAARAHLAKAGANRLDAGRTLRLHWIAFKLGTSPPPTQAQIEIGLAELRQTAARYHNTPYGAAIEEQLASIETRE